MKFRSSSFTKLLLVLVILSAGRGDEESRQQLEILRQIAADTPLYPGFMQLRSSDYHKTSHATVIRCYSVRADDGDVRRFYSQLFASKGWTLATLRCRSNSLSVGNQGWAGGGSWPTDQKGRLRKKL